MSDYNKRLGVKLRTARTNAGLSLDRLAAQTHGEFKASAVGSYERGERAISVERFARLCSIYAVHPVTVLPEPIPYA